jgi:hypothetical protein
MKWTSIKELEVQCSGAKPHEFELKEVMLKTQFSCKPFS